MMDYTFLIFGLIGIVGLFIYLIPTFVASSRKHESFGWIFFLNIIAGWTGILWIALLLWAGLGNKKENIE